MKKWLAVLLAAVLIGSAGCGEEDPGNGGGAVRVMNYTFQAKPHELVFQDVPERVLVCGESGAETLAALSAGSRIAAVVLTDGSAEARIREKLPQAEILRNGIAREYAVTLRPDFILGWRRFFDERQLGDTADWSRQGIPAYIEEASGPIPAVEPFPPCTVDSEKAFITHMGQIFREEEKAGTYVRAIDEELRKGEEEAKGKLPKVLVVEFMGKSIEVFGEDLLAGDIIRRLGGEVVSFPAPFVSREELITADADVIFVVYHGEAAAGEAMAEEIRRPLYEGIPAVKNGRVYLLPYRAVVAPGVNTTETIRYMRERMYQGMDPL